jgi:hypothetical protein
LTLLLLRRFVNASISRTREFFVQRLPTLSAPAALADHGAYDLVHPSSRKHRVHTVAEPARLPFVVLTTAASHRCNVLPVGGRFNICAHRQLEEVAFHVIVTNNC